MTLQTGCDRAKELTATVSVPVLLSFRPLPPPPPFTKHNWSDYGRQRTRIFWISALYRELFSSFLLFSPPPLSLIRGCVSITSEKLKGNRGGVLDTLRKVKRPPCQTMTSTSSFTYRHVGHVCGWNGYIQACVPRGTVSHPVYPVGHTGVSYRPRVRYLPPLPPTAEILQRSSRAESWPRYVSRERVGRSYSSEAKKNGDVRRR